MDVHTENMDPPPSECQPSGKIRKGFKLFGKRKPSNIFSLKNNKSPVTRSHTVDGLPEGAAPDYELEVDKEKPREVSQGYGERAEEEQTGEDGVLAASRNSISSSGSAKSIRFFSRLRGARRGGGDRKVHTVSQPVTRQRQGLKSLFGSMKLRPKDKEDKEEALPSPLLMSSRSNSVEIIKEDIGLTPKSPLRSLESRGKASSESSLTAAGDVSRLDEDAVPVPATEPPGPTESSLGSLLDDISSLLTFESISGGDIMADVKAEWGKARWTSTPETPEVSASATSPSSKPAATTPLSSATVTTSSSPLAAGGPSIPCMKPPTSSSVATLVVTNFTKSSTLTTQSVKLSLDSSPTVVQPSIGITVKSIPTTTNEKLSPSPPIMSAPSITMKTAPGNTSMKQAALDKTQVSTCDSTFGKETSSYKATSALPSPSQTIPSVSKPPPVATTLLPSHKPAGHSLSSPATFTQPDSNFQTSSHTRPQNVAENVQTGPSPVKSKTPLILHTTITTTLASVSKPVQSSSETSVPPNRQQPEPSPTNFKSFSIAAKSPVSLDSNILAVSQEPPSIPATPLSLVTGSADPPVPSSLVSATKVLPIAVPTTSEPPVPAPTPVYVPKGSPAPEQIPINQWKSPVLPASSSPATTPVPLPSEAAPSNKMNAMEPSTNGQLSRLQSTNAQTTTVEEQHNGSRVDVPKERKTQVKALSKIPVVGGGRAGKLPVRDSQHTDDESSRDPPTPIEEHRRHLDFHNIESRDKAGSVDVHVPMFKHSQGGSQPVHQSKAPAGVPCDSKIPVKHGAQSPPGSQIPQAKETPRTKIPVSRVPVRRVGNKPATAGAVRK